jgi:hypothetical protein
MFCPGLDIADWELLVGRLVDDGVDLVCMTWLDVKAGAAGAEDPPPSTVKRPFFEPELGRHCFAAVILEEELLTPVPPMLALVLLLAAEDVLAADLEPLALAAG